MSRRTRIHFAPALALALLAAAGLVRPSIAFAQTVTAEQALLNQTAPPVDLTASFSTMPSVSFQSGSADVAGDRALLGRIEAPSAWERYFGTVSRAEIAIDGERALLGRWPFVQPSQAGDWARRVINQDTEKS